MKKDKIKRMEKKIEIVMEENGLKEERDVKFEKQLQEFVGDPFYACLLDELVEWFQVYQQLEKHKMVKLLVNTINKDIKPTYKYHNVKPGYTFKFHPGEDIEKVGEIKTKDLFEMIYKMNQGKIDRKVFTPWFRKMFVEKEG